MWRRWCVRPRAYGAKVANRARVTGFLREGERVVGARVQDVEARRGVRDPRQAGRQRHRACGPTTPRRMVGERGQFHVRASKGIHLVVPKDRIHSTTGLILRTEKSVLFVIPWGRHWIVGTTDTDWDLDKAHPAASSADIDYLLEHVNSVLAVPLTQGRRPGRVRGPAARCSPVSRTPPASCRASTPWRIRCRGSWSWRAASTRRTG